MKRLYEIAVDVGVNSESEYHNVTESANGEFCGGFYDPAASLGTIYLELESESLDDAFKEVYALVDDSNTTGKIKTVRDTRIADLTLHNANAGYLPEGYTHVSSGNPRETGFYWCLCETGSMSAELTFTKQHFRKEHNSRWCEGDWTRTIAWTK